MIKRFSNYVISSDNDYENSKEIKDTGFKNTLNEEKKTLENKNDKNNNTNKPFK